jgi:hypothetical protein
MTTTIKQKFSDDKKIYVCLELDKRGFYTIGVSVNVCDNGLYYDIAHSQDICDREKAIKAFYGYCYRYINKR